MAVTLCTVRFVIRLEFGEHKEGVITSCSEWSLGNEFVASAILAEIFRRFPDAIQNIVPGDMPAGHVVVRTKANMPSDWKDGSVRRSAS